MMKRKKQGFSLVIVLPFILMLFLLGLYFLETVLTRSEYEVIDLTSVRLKYAAISASQLALLEVSECGMITEDSKRKQKEIPIQLMKAIPTSAKMFLGGTQEIQWFDYTLSQRNLMAVRSGLPSKAAMGTYLYAGVDLDGDGRVGSITNKQFLNATLNASITENKNI